MSKSVLIPSDMRPFRCIINGAVYEYKEGTTQSVPDEVAALIEAYNRAKPSPAPEPGTAGQVWTRLAAGGAGWVDLPEQPVIPVAANVEECAATDVAGCVTSINAILDALIDAGLMEEPEEPESPESPEEPEA